MAETPTKQSKHNGKLNEMEMLSVPTSPKPARIESMSPDTDKERTIEFSEDKYFGQTRMKEDKTDVNDSNIMIMKNVHKTYLLGVEGVTALRGVSLTIKRGEFVCIFGTSGGGKTTMLNIMGTIDKPTKGELYIGGSKITSNTKDFDLSTIRLKKIGFVFQTFNLLSSMTAQENVEMPMILAGDKTASERKQRAKELLTMVGMGKRLDHFPSMLSGGEQQRVTIARAIANKPELLLLDEPTGDLDSVNTLNVLKILTDLNQNEGITMVMVTHDVALKAYADRVVWMRDGKIQRIDITARRAKQAAVESLHRELDSLKKRKKLKDHGTGTEVRLPHDYRTYKQYHEREIPILSPKGFDTFVHDLTDATLSVGVVERAVANALATEYDDVVVDDDEQSAKKAKSKKKKRAQSPTHDVELVA